MLQLLSLLGWYVKCYMNSMALEINVKGIQLVLMNMISYKLIFKCNIKFYAG